MPIPNDLSENTFQKGAVSNTFLLTICPRAARKTARISNIKVRSIFRLFIVGFCLIETVIAPVIVKSTAIHPIQERLSPKNETPRTATIAGYVKKTGLTLETSLVFRTNIWRPSAALHIKPEEKAINISLIDISEDKGMRIQVMIPHSIDEKPSIKAKL